MTTQEILTRYINFFKDHGHAETPNVSLVPDGNSTLLFVNSGMFPLVPYLSGEPHPLGRRLVNVQRSMRFAEDLDEVGDNRHTTAFHMLGNWSLGDYFKKEQLSWIYQFFIEEIGLDPRRIYGSVFEGDENASRDEESIKIIKEIFSKYGIVAKEDERIFAYGKEYNWWQRGDAVGELGGPDSEHFYYIGQDGDGLGLNPADNQDDFIEIGNSVFMQYKKSESGWEELPQKNVDFGGGLERIAMVAQGKNDVFETDMFWPIVEKIQDLSGKKYLSDATETESMRILADHIRAAVFLAMDGVVPSNKDQGYVLRRYLRRMVRYARKLDITQDVSVNLVGTVAEMFEWLYPQINENKESITEIFKGEEERFFKTLTHAGREVEKRLSDFEGDEQVLAALGFDLYQSLGFPPEMFAEEAEEKGVEFDKVKYMDAYEEEVKNHQAGSRKGAEQKFKGGLEDHSKDVVRYHTATHLLNYALRTVLGDQVGQKGSNITGERLRFDFNHDQKLTDEELEKVQEIVNAKIRAAVPVNYVMLPKAEAEKTGAIHAFGEKYGDLVKVYYLGESLEEAFSVEFCGGPHVNNTNEIDPIEIYKQESVGKGVRRLYAKTKAD